MFVLHQKNIEIQPYDFYQRDVHMHQGLPRRNIQGFKTQIGKMAATFYTKFTSDSFMHSTVQDSGKKKMIFKRQTPVKWNLKLF